MARTDALRKRDDVVERHPLAQRLVGGGAYHRAIGKRVGERHAELDYVCALGNQRLDGGLALLKRWIANSHVRDKSAASLGLGLCKAVCNSLFHDFSSCMFQLFAFQLFNFSTFQLFNLLYASIFSRSLSPRPERHTRRIVSLGSDGARLMASASAWLDSSAGMMPS